MEATTINLRTGCPATRIPSGEQITLPEGSELFITQALGGSVTVRDQGGLYRVDQAHLDAFGPEVAAQLRDELQATDLSGQPFSEQQLWDSLRQCFDPEIPVNIVDLGLIYDLHYEEIATGRYNVGVKMTLTAPGCGMGPTIANDAQSKLQSLPSVETAQVDIVWDPQWTPQMISPEGRKILGLG
ncbi:MAG: iron-sulfur cluster assembly protein [Verrucomicrobiota bacterium JB022]|nr:iron-sulfur cluster assembly protein [Verrucomicrobiota bacterium JB022]